MLTCLSLAVSCNSTLCYVLYTNTSPYQCRTYIIHAVGYNVHWLFTIWFDFDRTAQPLVWLLTWLDVVSYFNVLTDWGHNYDIPPVNHCTDSSVWFLNFSCPVLTNLSCWFPVLIPSQITVIHLVYTMIFVRSYLPSIDLLFILYSTHRLSVVYANVDTCCLHGVSSKMQATSTAAFDHESRQTDK